MLTVSVVDYRPQTGDHSLTHIPMVRAGHLLKTQTDLEVDCNPRPRVSSGYHESNGTG